ncbi:MAG: type II/IV secretion system ATPase subunit [Candidatus Methanoperedens sp.]|nr:type II/IV secretion system ATPase subunit [Candidatus Methanoperedens sp.]
MDNNIPDNAGAQEIETEPTGSNDPPLTGMKKVSSEIRLLSQFLQKKFHELKKDQKFNLSEVLEVPSYDPTRFGEITVFEPQKDLDIVEQEWILRPFVLVTILHNSKTQKKLYFYSEPKLDDFETSLFQHISNNLKIFLLEQKIDFNNLNKELVLYNNYIKILYIYGISLDQKSIFKIWYHIKINYIGYGKIDALMKDPMIEDISCVGADTPIFLYHRKYSNIETNITFTESELNEMVLKLAQLTGKSISFGFPIMNATLPDGSRLEATLGKEVTTRGGTITIRKFREDPFSPSELIKYGTYSVEIMAYLWLAVENNKSIILVGGTASGKTTALNAISQFIPSESKIITIEDTREITLFHKNWIPGLVRETFTGQESQSIDMFELLRSALRQRPEYLIMGEVRGKEAYTLFQAMSTGHTTYSTMHASSVQTAVNRLLHEPINIPLMMLTALDIMVVQVMRQVGRKRVRRMDTLSEFVGVDSSTGNVSIQELYKWNASHDTMEKSGSSKVLDNIMINRGWEIEQLKKEMENRMAVIQYVVDNDIGDYRDFSTVIQMYASDPANVLELIKEGKPLIGGNK